MKNSTNMPYENIVVIIGRVLSINKVHERLGASFYEVNVRINRLTAGKYDDVIIYAPQWAMPTVGLAVGDTVRLVGLAKKHKLLITAGSDFHSYNDYKHGNVGCVRLTGEDLNKFLKKVGI